MTYSTVLALPQGDLCEPGSVPRVAVGVNGMPNCVAAAGWAAWEAERLDGAHLLVEALAPAPLDAEGVRRHFTGLRECDAVTGRTPLLQLGFGPAADILLDAARTSDLLVLGKRGGTCDPEWFAGSTALDVARRTTGPVVVVPGNWRQQARAHLPIVVALMAADDSGPGPSIEGQALDFAFARASSLEVPLIAVADWRGFVRDGDLDPARRPGMWSSELLAQLAPWRRRFPQVELIASVEVISHASALLLAGSRAQLTVVGRGTADGGRTILGPTLLQVLHRATCPSAVVPSPSPSRAGLHASRRP